MDFTVTDDMFEVSINAPFNLSIKNLLESRIPPEIQSLRIDLSQCKLLDSEAVIFMYRWHMKGKSLEVINPPQLFHEILQILELNDHWTPNISKTYKN